jgi:hypothetical protein
VVYFVLALAMFRQVGYMQVRDKLTAWLAGLDLPRPSEKARRDLPRRLGPAALKALSEGIATSGDSMFRRMAHWH